MTFARCVSSAFDFGCKTSSMFEVRHCEAEGRGNLVSSESKRLLARMRKMEALLNSTLLTPHS